jgi:hypothetical protein
LGQQNSQTSAPGSPYERTFSQPKAKIEKALKELQTSLSGRLPHWMDLPFKAPIP